MEEKSSKRKRKVSIYTIILIIWLVLVAGGIVYGLLWFNGFTEDYEAQYQKSLPYHTAEKVVDLFAKRNVDEIWNLMTDKPQLSEFETEDSVRKYIEELIKDRKFTYKQTDKYTEEEPEYYIISDAYIMAKLGCEIDDSQKLPFGFKAYKTKALELYTAPSYKFKVTAPENYTVMVNGKELSEKYINGQMIVPEENQYVDPYGKIPSLAVYSKDGFYDKPVVTAKDEFGNKAELTYDEAADEYKVAFNNSIPDRKDAEEFAKEFTAVFANYISQDAGATALDKYFPQGSKALSYIKRNSSRDLYTKHGAVTIENVEVRDFIGYTEDICYIEVYLEQWMKMYWGSEKPEVVPTDAHLYLCRIDGQWKVAGIKY